MFSRSLFAALLLATPVFAEGDGPGPNLVIEVAGIVSQFIFVFNLQIAGI